MLKIGKIELDVPVVQAALSGYSDAAMRVIARRLGAPYCVHEVVLDKLVLQPGKLRKKMFHIPDEDHPVGGQLMGAEPERFAEAAAVLVEAGFDVIDINFGCPVRKVLGRCRGGFLLSDPPTALEILRRVRDAVPRTVPLTLKMRRGMDNSAESERDFYQIFDAALELGLDAITVHGRTVEQRYVGPSRWEFLARVKERAGDRVILGSGDLFTAEDCVRMLEQTGVDGVWVARGAIGNPWIFREARALLAESRVCERGYSHPMDEAGARVPFRTRSGGSPFPQPAGLPDPPCVAEQGRVIRDHFNLCEALHGAIAPKIMRKFGIKYSELHPFSLEVRDAFIRSNTRDDWLRVLDEWYDSARAWPPGVRKSGPGALVAAGATLCEG